MRAGERTGDTKIVGVVANRGWQERTCRVDRCEDSSGVRFIDERARMSLLRIRRTYVQELTVSQDRRSMEGRG